MVEDTKCPKCGNSMELGFIYDKGQDGIIHNSNWVKGTPENSNWGGIKIRGKEIYKVNSYRCISCNFLEFYAKERIYI